VKELDRDAGFDNNLDEEIKGEFPDGIQAETPIHLGARGRKELAFGRSPGKLGENFVANQKAAQREAAEQIRTIDFYQETA